jgi:hypothetical protein
MSTAQSTTDAEYIATTEMLAEALTKALPKPAFLEHCRGMGLITEGWDKF